MLMQEMQFSYFKREIQAEKLKFSRKEKLYRSFQQFMHPKITVLHNFFFSKKSFFFFHYKEKHFLKINDCHQKTFNEKNAR